MTGYNMELRNFVPFSFEVNVLSDFTKVMCKNRYMQMCYQNSESVVLRDCLGENLKGLLGRIHNKKIFLLESIDI